MGKTRLWRVDAKHVCGYHAPYMMIVTTEDRMYKAEAEALNEAKLNSRLSDFPKWNFEIYQVNKKLLNGKWYSEKEFQYKIGNVDYKEEEGTE